MILECLFDVRVPHAGAEHLFESRRDFGYVYDVAGGLGAQALATKKCVEIPVDDEHPYKGPAPEIPSHSPIV